MMKNFWQKLNDQQYEGAAEAFNVLDKKDQATVLENLYEHARDAQKPHSISVLYRKLHEGKTYEDFREAWFPPKALTDPKTVGGREYSNYFPGHIRVMSAVNAEDPNEIITVGLHWSTDKEFEEKMPKIMALEKKAKRGDSIARVAEKVKPAGFYLVTGDDNLGN